MTPEEEAAAKAETDRLNAERSAQEAETKRLADEEAARKAAEQGDKPKTLEEALAELEKQKSMTEAARKEAAERRVKLTEFEKAEKARKEAEMTDLEKAQARVKELEEENARNAGQTLDSSIEAAAATLGFQDPKDAVRLVDREKISDDRKNLDTLLKAVLKDKPYLAKTGKGALPGIGGGGDPGGALEDAADKEKLGRMEKLFPAIGRLRRGRN
jgi:alanyl-tRNA synthetase